MANKYVIRVCLESELEELQEFIKINFKAEHIFAFSSGFLKWQHHADSFLNFIVARNADTNELDGIMGFIPTAHFDAALTDNRDFWGAIWAVSKNAPLGLGVALIKEFLKIQQPKSYGSIGISPSAKSIFQIFKQKLGHLNHYYFLNPYSEGQIASVQQTAIDRLETPTHLKIRELDSVKNIMLLHKYRPQKSITYLYNRYEKHPIYKYRFLGIYHQQELLAVWIFRKQFVGDASCIRVVDIYGDLTGIGKLNSELVKFLRAEKSEYLDCLNYGIDEKIFQGIGFSKLDFEGDEIVPNYFEPYVKANIKIDFAVKSEYEDYVMFKADADQDRPNSLLVKYE